LTRRTLGAQRKNEGRVGHYRRKKIEKGGMRMRMVDYREIKKERRAGRAREGRGVDVWMQKREICR